MAIFYQPPPPFIGGRQPYDPGRRVTPPVSEGNPPFAQATRGTASDFWAIRQWWDIPPPQPTQLARRVTPPVGESNPPFASPTRGATSDFGAIRQWWEVPPPAPTQLQPKQIVSVAQADNPPFRMPARDVERYIRTYDPELWKRSQYSGGNEVVPPPVADVPPPTYSRAQFYQLVYENLDLVIPIQLPVSSKIITQAADQPYPPDYQPPMAWYAQWTMPQQLEQVAAIIPPSVQVPYAPKWLAGVIQAWQPAPPQPQQLPPTQIVSEGPPVPTLEWQQNSLLWWYVPWQMPQQLQKLPQGTVVGDQPPTAQAWQQPALAWWYVPWQYPQTLTPIAAVIPAVVAAVQPPYAPAWLPSVLQAWQVPVQPTQFRPTQIVSEGPPPPTNTVMLNFLARSWQPGPPQPYQLVQYRPIPPDVVNNPPFPGVNWLNTVLQTWQPGPPQPTQLVQNVVQEGAAPIPPIPPDVPPPVRGAPIYWPGTSSTYREDIAEERKARDRKARVEIGLIKAEKAAAAVEERIEQRIERQIEKPAPAKSTPKPIPELDVNGIAKKVAQDVKQDLRKLQALQKRIEELEMENEALEAMIIFLKIDL